MSHIIHYAFMCKAREVTGNLVLYTQSYLNFEKIINRSFYPTKGKVSLQFQ